MKNGKAGVGVGHNGDGQLKDRLPFLLKCWLCSYGDNESWPWLLLFYVIFHESCFWKLHVDLSLLCLNFFQTLPSSSLSFFNV